MLQLFIKVGGGMFEWLRRLSVSNLAVLWYSRVYLLGDGYENPTGQPPTSCDSYPIYICLQLAPMLNTLTLK